MEKYHFIFRIIVILCLNAIKGSLSRCSRRDLHGRLDDCWKSSGINSLISSTSIFDRSEKEEFLWFPILFQLKAQNTKRLCRKLPSYNDCLGTTWTDCPRNTSIAIFTTEFVDGLEYLCMDKIEEYTKMKQACLQKSEVIAGINDCLEYSNHSHGYCRSTNKKINCMIDLIEDICEQDVKIWFQGFIGQVIGFQFKRHACILFEIHGKNYNYYLHIFSNSYVQMVVGIVTLVLIICLVVFFKLKKKIMHDAAVGTEHWTPVARMKNRSLQERRRRNNSDLSSQQRLLGDFDEETDNDAEEKIE